MREEVGGIGLSAHDTLNESAPKAIDLVAKELGPSPPPCPQRTTSYPFLNPHLLPSRQIPLKLMGTMDEEMWVKSGICPTLLQFPLNYMGLER